MISAALLARKPGALRPRRGMDRYLSRDYSREMPLQPELPPHEGASHDANADLRRVTDARTLRALAHPVRIALIEALILGGAMTATQVGERIGESPTTCSFHLRQLAKYGFVEEAGGGRGRARPWRMRHIGMTVPGPGKLDATAQIAAHAVARLARERW